MGGQILGDRYRVEKQLGKKLGRWTLLASDLNQEEAPVILKLISMDDDLHPDMLRLFEREVEILKTLEHPDIPRYLDYFEVDLAKSQKALVLVQTFIEGVSADRYLQQGRIFSEAETHKVARSVLKILTYLHEHQPSIIHRDIKPSNILLTTPPGKKTKICLVDFGSVKTLVSRVSHTTVLGLIGTEGYMAPEQLGGRPVKASDLYSLGTTLITLATGMEPVNLPRRGQRIDLTRLNHFSPDFAAWLAQMTEIDISRRFNSAQTALQALG
ncbi:MAG: serine/threonine-protein kinase [Synechococcales bacterium]|nr:serine/threonine-protein kinase [Synechococcales bacterium]